MSRSKHTDPISIRAKRRVRAPFEPRSAEDLVKRRVKGLMFDGSDASPASAEKGGYHPASRPRILWRQPRPGFHHPLSERDVLELLESVGALAVYGLRSIELTRCRNVDHNALMAFGRYEAPGRIFLFEQPLPPWRLRRRLAARDMQRFERTGARITQMPQSGVTSIDWPTDTLRGFMLEEVLLHELGHHVLQFHKGKRLVRIARTKDHEAFAALFAQRQSSRMAARKFSAG